MEIGNGRVGLCGPIPIAGPEPVSAALADLVPMASGWWDASTPSGLLGPNSVPVAVWNTAGTALADRSGNGRNLRPFYGQSASGLPQGQPHLCGLLGGVGYPSNSAGLLQPALNPDAGWEVPGPSAGAASSWTWYFVWSRPNWRQGSGRDAAPITLMTIGSTPLLQIDSNAGISRLVLFPGGQEVVLSQNMARRHTHSIVIRYVPTVGADVWLDSDRLATGIGWTFSGSSTAVLLLHDSTAFGAAQCWLHEAAEWGRSILDSEVSAILTYAARWTRGTRKGIFLLFNGQSNAINYALNDGAAMLLARGIAWHLGALAYNILATQGSSTSYTMQSGHGIYVVGNGGYPYPGSFVTDPGDGSNPAGWPLGADGIAVRAAVASLSAQDSSDVCAIIWPWSETDCIREYSELQTFQSAAVRFMALLRAMLGDSIGLIPVVWWNAIPYGSIAGITMHRQAVQTVSDDPSHHVIVGNPQTSDSNARDAVWDPMTGLSTGGDAAHRDSADHLRFARLASPVIARALVANARFDSISLIPDVLPKVGGPRISHVFKQAPSVLVITISHDTATDLRVPLQAASGLGFSVMDGGSASAPGPVISAVSCQRLDATHLQLVLANALRNVAGLCMLYYPYGPQQIGRGNAVTDNYSSLPKPAGWDASTDLGPDWAIDFPLSATFSGIQLSDTPV